MSRNAITHPQIELACQHVQEMMRAGITENMAIRTLELFVDVYGKVRNGGTPSPHHVSQVTLWSAKARQLKRKSPTAKPRDFFRVEHGTPRRELARLVLKLHTNKKLTIKALNKLVKRHWKLAVITVEEDSELNRISRSKMHSSPEERWTAAKIKF